MKQSESQSPQELDPNAEVISEPLNAEPCERGREGGGGREGGREGGGEGGGGRTPNFQP